MATIKMKQEAAEKKKRTDIINAEVAYFLKLHGYKKEDLALKLRMSTSSLYAKLADIDRFTYPEIRNLCATLDLDDSVKLALIA